MASQSVTTPRAAEPTSRGFAAILVAIVAVALGRGIAGAMLAIPESFSPLSWAELVGTATLVGIGASIAYTLLVRATDRPDHWFVVAAGSVLVLSFVVLAVVGQTLPGATTELLAALAAIHAVVAVGVSLPLLHPGPRTEVEAGSTGW